MNTKSNPFLDVADRFYALGTSASNRGFINIDNRPSTNQIRGFWNGRLSHVIMERGNTFYVRYVPRESVQWIFDTYGV